MLLFERVMSVDSVVMRRDFIRAKKMGYCVL